MESENDADHDDEISTAAVRELPAENLFGEEKEIVILHDGQRYRLRITRKNKLILQK